MSGISDKAIKSNYAENKYRFNGGSELQNKEFTDGSGLEEYDASARMYDPQIGRFWSIDPNADENENFSPYAFATDNPILFNDPLGADTTCPGCMQEAIVTQGNNSSGVALADTKGGAPNVSAGPAPESATSPIQSNPTEATAGFAVTVEQLGGGLGEGIEITDIGGSSVLGGIVVGGLAVGYGVMGLQEWARPKNYHEPTNVPTGDISIGVPKPYIPPSLINSSYPRGESVYPFPGWDPTKAPPGYQWKGKPGSTPGSKDGNWNNPGTGESLRPELDHPYPVGPHWDYKDADGKWHRLYPDGTSEQKKDR